MEGDYLDHMLKNVEADFDSEIQCHLCNGILRDAHTVIECGDSFCKNCICVYFSNKKNTSCPKCHENMGERPLE